jgi:hypothetical protein
LLSRSVRILSPTSPPLAHSRCRVCSVGILGARWWCRVPAHPLPRTPGAAFAFALGQDLGGGPIPTLALSRALSAPHLLGQDPWWRRRVPACPLPRAPGAAVPTHPLSCCVCSVWILGGGAVCLLALSCTLPEPLCLLALSRTPLAPHLLGRDPWWWHHVPILAPSRGLPRLADKKGLQAKGSQPASGTHLSHLHPSTERGTG